jgi:hypothetical protein
MLSSTEIPEILRCGHYKSKIQLFLVLIPPPGESTVGHKHSIVSKQILIHILKNIYINSHNNVDFEKKKNWSKNKQILSTIDTRNTLAQFVSHN